MYSVSRIQRKLALMLADLVQIDTSPGLADRVYGSLLDAISDGTLAPGVRLTQEGLAASLNVSRQPVLQALRLLKKDGLIVDEPGRGLLVAPLDLTLLAQVYVVRGALDSPAARLSAQGKAVLDARLIERGRKASAGRSVKAMIEADLAFHQAIYAASDNTLLDQAAQLHWRHPKRAMGAVLQSSTLRRAVWDEHEAMAQAIAAGDAKRSSPPATAHCEQAAAHMQEHLGQALATEAPTRSQGDVR